MPDESRLSPEKTLLPESTTRENHRKEVDAIVESLRGNSGKTVAARAIRIERVTDVDATFRILCEDYPDAFVFCFSTPDTGTWIGASPELLLKKENSNIQTMALAGTRPSGTDGEWDMKNREEQEMVTHFIESCLSTRCNGIKTGKTYTKQAGSVEHICTPISAILHAHGDHSHDEDTYQTLGELLCDLSPTPALCGSDREASMRLIERLEDFDREMYGGFCGPCDIDGKTEIYVNLRSAKCSDTATCVYAGGGITHLSRADEEWNETEIKSRTIINKLKTV